MKSISILTAFTLITILSHAQVQRKTMPSNATDSLVKTSGLNSNTRNNRRQMLKELDLTKEQRSKLKEIRSSAKAKKEAIDNNDKLSDSEKKVQLRGLQKEQQDSLMNILNAEQRIKLKQKREALQKEGGRQAMQNN